MMRRVDLLPAAYAERRRQRQAVFAVFAIGGVLLLLLLGYYFLLRAQISNANEDLQVVQERNAGIEAEIAALQQFADLEREVQDKVVALQTVMVGDVDWPKLLAETAMAVPGEVWLTSFAGSAGTTEGSTTVGTETAAIRVNPELPTGRIAFGGRSLSMPGVAKWLIRQMGIRDFRAVWLNDATEDEEPTGGRLVVNFDSTLELSGRALSGRFQAGTQ